MDCTTDQADEIPNVSVLDSSKTSEYESPPSDYGLSRPDSPALQIREPDAYNYWSSAPRKRQLRARVSVSLRCNTTPFLTIPRSHRPQTKACCLSTEIDGSACRNHCHQTTASA